MSNNEEEKEVIEIVNDMVDDLIEVEEKNQEIRKKKKSLKDLTKNQKIIIISGIVLILIGIIGALVYFFVLKDDESKEEEKQEEVVILEKSNYRYENGVLIFLDKNDNEIGTYECINKDINSCMIATYQSEDMLEVDKYLNEEGNPVLFDVQVFNNRFAFIKDIENEEDNEILLYDLSTSEVINTYNGAKAYSNSKIIVQNTENKYGILELVEEVKSTTEFIYDNLSYSSSNQNILASKDSSYYIMDSDNETISEEFSDQITGYNENYLTIKISDSKYEIYELNGDTPKIDKNYDQIIFKNDYILFILDNLLYLRDNSFNVINEEAVNVEGLETYFKTVTLDENYNVLSEIDDLVLSVDNHVLTVNVQNKKSEFNLLETEINSSLDYVNYLEGFIYIYKDEDKTEVLGSYECINENNVTSSKMEYSNCNIATESKLLNRDNQKDTLGYIPIYNEQYIFIKDVKNLSANNNIYLYDFINGELVVKQPYIKVDVGYYNEDNKIVMGTTTNLEIMAQNTDGEYGMITLDKDGVEGLIPFVNDVIEYLNGKYLTKNVDGTYHLYNETGLEMTNSNSAIKNEIIDFNNSYIKVKDSNSQYLVYSMTGSIVSNPMDDIVLGDVVFAGETNKKIEVYKYSDGKSNILNSEITINGGHFELEDNGALGFNIKIYDEDNKLINTYKFSDSGAII